MDLKLDCLPCILRQVIEAGRMSTDNESLIKDFASAYADIIKDIDFEVTAQEITATIQEIIKEKTGQKDPYRSFKEENIKRAAAVYPSVKQAVEASDDPLLGALIMAATGNIIDAGISLEVDLQKKIEFAEEQGFKHSDYHIFQERLKGDKVKRILIIGDNAGEGVFDRLLIEELNRYQTEITYAVRDKPILNDITVKEAKEIGLDQVCRVILSGCATPGLILEWASSTFLQAFNEADIVISKGQGNLEGLLGTDREIFFLLTVKCRVIAAELGVNEGDLIFTAGQPGIVHNKKEPN